MNVVLACILAYVASQLLIAFWFSRKSRNEEDYLLAGRSLGPWMTGFAVFATWFGAETCIGATGEAYSRGLSGVVSDPFGYTLGIILMGLFFAAALYRRGLVTLADLFRNRYGPGVERLTAIIMIPTSVMWAAAQIRAFGQVLSSVSELGLFIAITFAATVVIAYTVVGGMWANAVTDLVQGIVIILGVVVLGAVFLSLGGLDLVAAQPVERRSFKTDRSWPDLLNTLAVPIFSTIAAQELAARTLAARNAHIARNATVVAGGVYLVIGLVPVMIGLAGAAVIGADADPEQVLSRFAQQTLPMPLYILFLGALVSAILSTLSGALLVAGALAGRNLVRPLTPNLDDAARLRVDRLAVLGFGVVAYVIALTSEGVYELVQQASALGSSGILVMMLFALWGGRFGGAASAYGALIAGTGVWLLGEHVLGWSGAYIVSLAAALLAYVLASPITGRAATPVAA
ncbi:MAG TPA: sodium:solute symporter family protein [Verrucomicrobiae bacterium]|nr:sodium:solute symporter family protein [Verrucomicrobiae bacterium]